MVSLLNKRGESYVMKRIILGVNIIATIVLGFTIAQISNLLYRYKRIHTFIVENVDELIVELPSKLAVLWWIWAILFLTVIIQLLLEFRSRGSK